MLLGLTRQNLAKTEYWLVEIKNAKVTPLDFYFIHNLLHYVFMNISL